MEINIILRKGIKPQESKKKRKKKEEIQTSQKTMQKMEISIYLSIITLYVNGINSPIERHTVTE